MLSTMTVSPRRTYSIIFCNSGRLVFLPLIRSTLLKDGLVEDGEEEAYRYMADVAELSDNEAEYFTPRDSIKTSCWMVFCSCVLTLI